MISSGTQSQRTQPQRKAINQNQCFTMASSHSLRTAIFLHRRLSVVTSRQFNYKTVSTGRFFSTYPSNQTGDPEGSPIHPQPFVQTVIQPGEWDPQRKDPLYRPKFKSRAKILSAEDYANRPLVGFSSEFENFTEAMVTLSWLDHAEQKRIYQHYLDMMFFAQTRYRKTSHEYVCRVIAQNHNITATRVAGIIQLQHNEEQYKKDPNYKFYSEAQAFMDKTIKEEIEMAYESEGLKKPDNFVEDPVGVGGIKESKSLAVVDDVLDMDKIMENTILREQEQARLLIDGHIYKEDIDDETIVVPLSKDCKRLLKAKSEFEQTRAKEDPSIVPWPDKNGQGERRPRWKFAAKTVNIRELKKNRKKYKSYRNNDPFNTLVEEDGKLRVANMAEAKRVAWKPVRDIQEHIFANAKKGWLDRTLRGDESAWGKEPVLLHVENVEAVSDASNEEESSSDSSSGNESESTSESEDEEGEQSQTEPNEDDHE